MAELEVEPWVRGEAVTRGSVLDAVPANVAVLDATGVIVEVNWFWRRFGATNDQRPGRSEIGSNYLEVCDRAKGDRAEEASEVAAGIRRVLAGEIGVFRLEYPCHAPHERRWFHVVVTPLEASPSVRDKPHGAMITHFDVTAHKRRAEEMLDQSSSLLRMASRVSRLGAWWIDLAGEKPTLHGSREIHEILGLPPDYLPDQNREFERFIPEHRRALLAAFERCIREGVGFDLQVQVVGNSGQRLWARSIGEAVRDESGRIVRVQGAFQDISAQKAAEETLAESRLRFRHLADSMPHIVFTSDPDGRVDFANAAYTRYAGLREDEVTGGWLRAFHPDDADRAVAVWTEAVKSGESREAQIRIRRGADGAYRWHQIGVVPVRDATGAIVKWYGSATDVDDVVQLELDASRLAHRLTTTLESLTDGFFSMDRDGRVHYWNAEAERMSGLRRDEVVGRTLWDAFPTAVGSRFDREYSRALADNVAVSFEAHNPELGKWLEVRAYPSTEGLAVYFRDVTERRAAREALRESEERFRLLASATNDAIWDWNYVTDAVWWNEGFEALFGYRRDEIESTIDSWYERIHPDDRGETIAGIHRAAAGSEDSWTDEYRFLRKDGTYAWVLDRGNVIRDTDGKAIRLIGGMTDLTERKRAEERLAEQAALLDAAHEAIVARDLDDRVIYWNGGAERTYGWTSAEALGRGYCDLLELTPDRYAEAFAVVLERGEWAGELGRRTKDGREIVVEAHWTLVRDAAGVPRSVLAIANDVTERKKLEQQFLRAQRLESIGTLAGGIAHDLNNLLAPICMGVDLLKTYDLDARSRRILGNVEVSAKRGVDLVKQVLSFARGVDGARVSIDSGHVLREVEAIVERTFPKDVRIDCDVAHETWPVRGDPTQLHQVLLNLCVNARDAMPQGGHLTLRVQNHVIDHRDAGSRRGLKPGRYVMIEVGDTGCGIARDHFDRIFEPFFTTKEIGQGTGLGLSTVQGIVRSHGGTVSVESELGRGATFRVFLPALDDPSKPGGALVLPEENLPRGDGETILVVDDEGPILDVTRQTLEAYGYRVITAEGGAQAVTLYAMKRREIAAVLTDMMMPVVDGFAVIGALRRIDPEVPIIASSGLTTTGMVARAVGVGVEHFLDKPYSTERLLTTLRTILGRAPSDRERPDTVP